MSVDHRPWSTFGEADRIAPFNPLRRVPTLMLDSGEVLVETFAILDHLDEVVGPERAMLPAGGPARRHALKTMSLAAGLADKTVALLYEQVLHAETSNAWVQRCRVQLGDTLDALEATRAAAPTPFLFGTAIGHADIAVACGVRLLSEAHPELAPFTSRPGLAAHAAHCEAMPAFQAVQQPLIRPA